MNISFHTLGDEALLVNFEQKIDPKINKQVHLLTRVVEKKKIEGLKYITPAYCSLVMAFDKRQVSFNQLVHQTKLLLNKAGVLGLSPRKLYIPVCYERVFALDMHKVILQTSLSASQIVKTHTSHIFKTYMIGFLPGFPYLGKLPQELECARQANPRLKVPGGSVGIAGLQTGIYPKESPGGWQIIGRTPVDLVGHNIKHPFLFETGDEVSFYSISKSKYEFIKNEQKKGKFNWNNVYEQAD